MNSIMNWTKEHAKEIVEAITWFVLGLGIGIFFF